MKYLLRVAVTGCLPSLRTFGGELRAKLHFHSMDTALPLGIAGISLLAGGWLIYATGAGCRWRLRRPMAEVGGVLFIAGFMGMMSLSPIPWF